MSEKAADVQRKPSQKPGELLLKTALKKTTKKPLLATWKQHKEMSADSDVLHSIVTIKKIVF